ncbi:Solute carrier family 22 member 23 [Bagarius yarrelli]|uniref:Solute carrier family 22 member 23 n=1 Tax=Bagarius yarrelli TaxID=175774 RepID=A0A556V749_BAGYA|nr:Solute carrier family 22 member 23 [Bagarius yarrelli]
MGAGFDPASTHCSCIEQRDRRRVDSRTDTGHRIAHARHRAGLTRSPEEGVGVTGKGLCSIGSVSSRCALGQRGTGHSRNQTADMEVQQQEPELYNHHHPSPPPPPPPENGFVTPEAPSPGLMLSRVDGCVLPFLGGFGRYQKQLVLLTWIPALFIGFSQFSDYFMLAQPNSTCVRAINGTIAPEHETVIPATVTTAPLFTHALHSTAEGNGSARASEHCAFGRHAVLVVSVFFTLVFGMSVAFSVNVTMGGGLGLVLASAGFGMLTAPIMELHNQKGYFLHHVIFACCTLICIICILLLPESRHQPLPESLSEGEGYTRHPLLPPNKKPAEQLHLLPGPHGRNFANDEHANNRTNDFSGIRDTPLREVAVSTVESTASSTIAPDEDPCEEHAEINAVRLSVLRHHDNSISTALDSLPDLIVNAPSPDSLETPPSHQTSSSTVILDYEPPPIMDNKVESSEGVSVDLPELVKPSTTNVAPTTLSFCPPPSSSSPIDSDPLLFPPSQTGSTPSEPPSPAILDETVIRSLPLTVTDPVPPFKVDLTTSSPIDSAVDCTISPGNGGASS